MKQQTAIKDVPIKHVSVRMPLEMYGRMKQYQFYLNEKGEPSTVIQALVRLVDTGLRRFEANREMAVVRRISQKSKPKDNN